MDSFVYVILAIFVFLILPVILVIIGVNLSNKSTKKAKYIKENPNISEEEKKDLDIENLNYFNKIIKNSYVYSIISVTLIIAIVSLISLIPNFVNVVVPLPELESTTSYESNRNEQELKESKINLGVYSSAFVISTALFISHKKLIKKEK